MHRKHDKSSHAGKQATAQSRSQQATQRPKLMLPPQRGRTTQTVPPTAAPEGGVSPDMTNTSPTQSDADVVTQQPAASRPETSTNQTGEAAATPVPEVVEPPAPTQEIQSVVTRADTTELEAAGASPASTPCEPLPVPLSAWQVCGVAVTGLAHHRKGLPCQDAVTWHQRPRVVLALSDGAGSAVISERGAAALVRGMSRFVLSLEDAVSSWLDQAGDHAADGVPSWSRRLLAHAQGLLEDLAQVERRSVRDVRATLQLVVLGTEHSFWWQVGDGTIVIQSSNGLQALSSPSQAKGEFANQTCFVDVAKVADVQCGLLSTAEVQGLALMSDGGAEKLVASDGSRVSTRLSSWFDDLACHALSAEKLAVAYHEPAMNERTTLDDRSVLLAARRPSP